MTYVYQELSPADIVNDLLADEYSGWTYEQADELAEYLIDRAEYKGRPQRFDRVSIRCKFAAYDSALDAAQDYGQEPKDEAAARDYLEANTTLIQCADGSIIIQQF